MNTHVDKTQENKSQSESNAESQMQNSAESTFQFVDNRPEAIAQRKLQEMANNSPQVSQLRAFQEMANNSSKVKQASNERSIVQLKPKDFKRQHTLSVDATGSVTNAEAGRDPTPVSYPLNALIFHKLVGVDEAVVGGHLFKREYGGPDDFSNVVTWNHASEDNFTTYENAYLNDARNDAQTKGAHDRVIETEAKFSTNKINVSKILHDDDDDSKAAKSARHKTSKLLAGGIESIPDKVKVTAEGRAAWEKSSKTEFVSGDLFPITKTTEALYNKLKNGEDVERVENAIKKIDEM
jgi:hypothetical protein